MAGYNPFPEEDERKNSSSVYNSAPKNNITEAGKVYDAKQTYTAGLMQSQQPQQSSYTYGTPMTGELFSRAGNNGNAFGIAQQMITTPGSPTYNQYQFATSTQQSRGNKYLDDVSRTETIKAQRDAWLEELTYRANDPKRTMSDKDLIDYTLSQSKYKDLVKLMDGSSSMYLTEGFDSLLDTGYAALWTARGNKSTGNTYMDSAAYFSGSGNRWEQTDDVAARMTYGSKDYNPYVLGANMGDTGLYFGRYDFDDQWLQDNASIKNGWDSTAIKQYDTVYSAQQFTNQAKDELNTLRQQLAGYIQSGVAPEQAFRLIDSVGGSSDYPALSKLQKSLETGKLLDTTSAIDYDAQALKQQYIADYNAWAEENNATKYVDEMGYAMGYNGTLKPPQVSNNNGKLVLDYGTDEEKFASMNGASYEAALLAADISAMIASGTATAADAYRFTTDVANGKAISGNYFGNLGIVESYLRLQDERDSMDDLIIEADAKYQEALTYFKNNPETAGIFDKSFGTDGFDTDEEFDTEMAFRLLDRYSEYMPEDAPEEFKNAIAAIKNLKELCFRYQYLDEQMSSQQDKYEQANSAIEDLYETYAYSDALAAQTGVPVNNATWLVDDIHNAFYGSQTKEQAMASFARLQNAGAGKDVLNALQEQIDSFTADETRAAYKGLTQRDDFASYGTVDGFNAAVKDIRDMLGDEAYSNGLTELLMNSDSILTDEEKKIAAYIYATSGDNGIRAVNDYLKNIDRKQSEATPEELAEIQALTEAKDEQALTAYLSTHFGSVYDREQAASGQFLESMGKNSPIAASLISLATNAANTVLTPAQIAATLAGADQKLMDKLFYAETATQSLRTGASSQMGDLGKFFYNAGMSIADNVLDMALGKIMAPGLNGEAAEKFVKNVSGIMMSSGAASSAMKEALDKGYDPGRAVIIGVFSGAIEMLTENMQFDRLFSIDGLADAFQSSLSEFSEEAVSEILGIATDTLTGLASGDYDWRNDYQELRLVGMSHNEAVKQIMSDRFQQVLLAGAAGGLSGGVMSVGGYGINRMRQARANTQYQQDTRNQEVLDRLLSDFNAERTAADEAIVSQYRSDLYANTESTSFRDFRTGQNYEAGIRADRQAYEEAVQNFDAARLAEVNEQIASLEASEQEQSSMDSMTGSASDADDSELYALYAERNRLQQMSDQIELFEAEEAVRAAEESGEGYDEAVLRLQEIQDRMNGTYGADTTADVEADAEADVEYDDEGDPIYDEAVRTNPWEQTAEAETAEPAESMPTAEEDYKAKRKEYLRLRKEAQRLRAIVDSQAGDLSVSMMDASIAEANALDAESAMEEAKRSSDEAKLAIDMENAQAGIDRANETGEGYDEALKALYAVQKKMDKAAGDLRKSRATLEATAKKNNVAVPAAIDMDGGYNNEPDEGYTYYENQPGMSRERQNYLNLDSELRALVGDEAVDHVGPDPLKRNRNGGRVEKNSPYANRKQYPPLKRPSKYKHSRGVGTQTAMDLDSAGTMQFSVPEAQQQETDAYSREAAALIRAVNGSEKNQVVTIAGVLFNATGNMPTNTALAAANAFVRLNGKDSAKMVLDLLMNSSDPQTVKTALLISALDPNSRSAGVIAEMYSFYDPDAAMAAAVAEDSADNSALMEGIKTELNAIYTADAVYDADMTAAFKANDDLIAAKKAESDANQKVEDAKAKYERASNMSADALRQFSENPGDQLLMKRVEALSKQAAKAQEAMENAVKEQHDATADVEAKQQAYDKLMSDTMAQARAAAAERVNAEVDAYNSVAQIAAEEVAKAAEKLSQEQNAVSEPHDDAQKTIAEMDEKDFENAVDKALEKNPQISQQKKEAVKQKMMQERENIQNKVSNRPAASKEFIEKVQNKYGVKIAVLENDAFYEGKYDRDSGTVYITEATTQSEALERVLLHELTHRIEGTEGYREVHDAILSFAYNGNKTKLDQDIKTKIKQYAKYGQKLDYEAAEKEIIANKVKEILYASEEDIARFVGENPSAAKRIWQGIVDFLKKLTGMDDPLKRKYDRVRQAFENALIDVAGRDQLMQANRELGIDADPKEQFSIKSFADATSLNVEEKDGVFIRLYDSNGKTVKKVTVDMLENTPMFRLIDKGIDNQKGRNKGKDITWRDTKGKMHTETADDYYKRQRASQKKFVADVMTMIAQNRDQALVWDMVGSSLFSAIKTNSDNQYGTTIDFGTICAKTQALVDVMSETMKRLGRGLTKEEVDVVYSTAARTQIDPSLGDVKGNYMAVPCSECYVYSRWIGVPALLEDIRQCQNKYADMSEAELNKLIEPYRTIKKSESESESDQNAEDVETTSIDKSNAIPSRHAKYIQQVLMEEAGVDKEGYTVYKKRKDIEVVPNDVLLDLNAGGEFADKFPITWKFRTTRGAALGKAIMPYSDARLGETIQGISNGAKNQNIKRGSDNPFFRTDKKGNKSANGYFNRAVEKAKAQNLIGGQRYQSTSDFRPDWGSDYLMTFFEMQAIGAQVQTYTKVIEAVDFLASVGAEVNLSLISDGDGWVTLEDGTEALVFSSRSGIDYEAALAKTNQYDNVQMIPVGISDKVILMELAGAPVAVKGEDGKYHIVAENCGITFVIPYHKSGSNIKMLNARKGAVGEAALVATDYEDVQSDKKNPKRTVEQEARWNTRVAILTGDKLTAEQMAVIEADRNLPGNEHYLADLYDKIRVNKDSEWYGVKLSAKQAGQSAKEKTVQIFPHEYWDTSLTIEQADENGERFKRYCESMGIIPRFSGAGTGKKAHGYFAYGGENGKAVKGYWKLLIDRPMYNRDGSYHKPQAIDVTQASIGMIPDAVSTSYGYDNIDAKERAINASINALKGNEQFSIPDDSIDDASFDEWFNSYVEQNFGELFADDEDTETVRQEVAMRTGLSGMYIPQENKAVMTQSRINDEIHNSGAGFNPTYARSLITSISPTDFIDLTVSKDRMNRSEFDAKQIGDYNTMNDGYDYIEGLKNSRQTPYLTIDANTGEVLGHEGRHRMRALEKAGIQSAEILVELYDDGRLQKDNPSVIPSMQITSQQFKNPSNIGTVIENLIPMNEANRSLIDQYYGENAQSGSGIQYSIPENEYQQLRQELLEQMEADGIDTSEYLRTARQFNTQTDLRSEFPSQQVKEHLFKNGSYTPHSWNETMESATRHIERIGFQRAAEQFLNERNFYNRQVQARGVLLFAAASMNNDYEMEAAIGQRYAEMGTDLAQALNVRKIFSRMTEQGRLAYINRVVDHINDRYEQQGRDVRVHAPEDMAERLRNCRNDAEREVVQREIFRMIAEQMEPDWIDRLRNWRMFAMLANPRTHIRNLAGNALFGPVIALKNRIGAGLETALGRVSEDSNFRVNEHTKNASGRYRQEYIDFARNIRALATTQQALSSNGGRYNDNQILFENRPVFTTNQNNLLERAARFNSNMLEQEDAVFLNRHFENALAGYLQSNNVEDFDALHNTDDGQALLNRAIEYAVREAQKATYHDFNAFAQALSRFTRREVGDSWFMTMGKTAISATIPFVKTPANIIKRGVEYSPANLLYSATVGLHQVRTGQMSSTEFVDRISCGLTGSLLCGLGFLLSSLGLVKVKPDELDKLTGSQDYSIEIGGTSFTADWIVPASMPLFVGAGLYENGMDEASVRSIYSSLINIMGPVFDLTMLDGVNNMFSSVQGSENPLVGVLEGTASNYIGQYIPTAVGALARTIDGTRRTTYADKNIDIPDWIQKTYQKVVNKIPGLSMTGQPYQNAWGESGADPVGERMFENWLSPGYINQKDVDSVEKSLMELYDLTHESGLIPKVGQKYFTVNGERINMTGKQYAAFNEDRGQTAHKVLQLLFSTPGYRALNDQQKVKAVEKAWDFATQRAKHNLAPDFAWSKWVYNNTPETVASYILDSVY